MRFQRPKGPLPTLAHLGRALPALAFFSGFLWDALTLGRRVGALDLWILTGYLAGAAAVLWGLGWRQARRAAAPSTPESGSPGMASPPAAAGHWRDTWRQTLAEKGPYLLLQFLFGGLFSALFIFYFKSSSHLMAYVWALGLGGLLVANEFLDDRYRRFTLTWALFGLCAMLLLNFVLPHLAGSVAGFWFYLSTLLGAGLAHGLWRQTPGRPGRTRPVWALAAGLMLAYGLDVLPPVPLVKRDLAVGYQLERRDGVYHLAQEKTPWWVFWRRVSGELHPRPGEAVYCVSAVFAPSGLHTRLYHRWEHREDGRGWVTWSRIGFGLAGGREGGYRGYTYKQRLAVGDWRVTVETENGRTVAIHRFRIAGPPRPADAPMLTRAL